MTENTMMNTNSTPEETGGQNGEKLFTQAQVNAIVQDRLAREREKLADGSEYRAKYEEAIKELESIKAAQVRQVKENAYRAIARLALDPEKTGYLKESRLNMVLKASSAEIDALELDEHGAAVGADKLIEHIKEEWADFVVYTTTQGAQISRPPWPPYYNGGEDRVADAFKPKI